MRRETKPGAAKSLVLAVAVGFTALILMASGATATSRVFVTSMTYNGDLKTAGSGLPGCGGGACADGLAGGDAICNARAAAGSLGGTWVAWLSTSTVDAKDRLLPGSGPFVRAAGTPAMPRIADNIADLIDTTLDDAILNTETGAALGNVSVWTGTFANGTATTTTCTDWTVSTGANGQVGSASLLIPGFWTNSGGIGCGSTAHLYCFEKVTAVPVPAVSTSTRNALAILFLAGLAFLYRRQSAG